MCGIVGVFGSPLGRDPLGRLLDDMNDALVHRGPDSSGISVSDGMGFAMRRLAIIDLSTGDQPIDSEDGNLRLVANGEIYNYRELTRELRADHQFATASDVEPILHLYEERGRDCVDPLRGMYAFAVWDVSQRSVFVARDRLGIKPLYYAVRDGELIFASEIKALLRHPDIDARLNHEALAHYLSLKYVPAPLTLFQDIHSLPPGHTLYWRDGETQIQRYWDIRYEESQQRFSEAEYAEQLEALLRETVRLHLRSDVPFGAFLSGGLDSSAIVQLMSSLLDEPVRTFAAGFEDSQGSADERPYARAVVDAVGSQHHEVVVRPEHFPPAAKGVVQSLDQPIADDASLATYMLAESAAKHVKMVLTGEGSDEIFAGYARHVAERFRPVTSLVPGFLREHLPALVERLTDRYSARLVARALSEPSEAGRLLAWFPLFTQSDRSRVFSSELRSELSGTDTREIVARCLAESDARTGLERMLYLDSKLWLPDFLLARGDKLTMAHSLEARVPFLDHKLVEFAAALPVSLKINGFTRKHLLRRVSADSLPKAIIDRPKKGFETPLSRWLRKDLQGFVRDLLAPETLRKRGLFDEGYVQQLLDDHRDGVGDHGGEIWGLAGVELWQQIWLDGA